MSNKLQNYSLSKAIKVLSYAFIVIIFCSSKFAFSQSSKITKVPNNTRNNGVSNNPAGYVEYLPNNYDSRNDWPVLIWFHGLGATGSGSASDLDKIANRHIMNWLKNNDIPFIVLAPQDVGGQFYDGLMQDYYDWSRTNYTSKSNDQQWHIQVLSASGGGMKNWLQVATPDLSTVNSITLSASILNGSGFTTQRYNNIINSGVRMWFHHGVNDNVVQIGGQRGFYKNLIQTFGGYDFDRFRFTAYTGLGHSAWNKLYNDSGITSSQSTGIIYNGNTVVGDYYHWTSVSWYDWMIGNTNTSQPPPVVSAGADKVINLPTNSTNLSGSATSDGGTIENSIWSKISGPTSFTLSNANTLTASISNLVAGIYTFRLTATDNLGKSAFDEVSITVNNANQSPNVSAGADKNISLPNNTVTINGATSDPDGNIASKVWTQRSGPSSASLTGVNSNVLNAGNLVEGTYTFRLTATDDDGASSFDEVNIVVNPEASNAVPTANAGPDRTVNLPTNSTNIEGSGTDSDGSISNYLWEKVSGPAGVSLQNENSSTLSLDNLIEGIYYFQLEVTDDDGAIDTDMMMLEVVATNINPNVNAGEDRQITLPTNSLVINGNASDNDGAIVSYTWEQTTGPNTATLTNADSPDVTVSDLIEGVYVFSLTATDDDNASTTDEVAVTVLAANVNKPPTVTAGNDIVITLPTNTTTLTAAANDPDGSIVQFSWIKQSGPSTFSISSPNLSSTAVLNLVAGTYVFKITVTDNEGEKASDNITVNVSPGSVNQSPVANAGPDTGLTLPTTSMTVNGVGTDPDGSIASYQWSQDSGPSSINIATPSTPSTVLSGFTVGVFLFSFQVTDNLGAINTDQIQVTVTAGNSPPIVSAGNDKFINLPQNSVTNVGSASDPDGFIASTNWTQTSGSNTTFQTSETTIEISELVEGTYTYQFSATDDKGAVTNDEFTLIVLAGTNLFPSVEAGKDITIKLPTNTINLTANASDPDGNIETYLWEKISGSSASFSNEATETTTINNLSAGEYLFQITVTDNEDGFASDQVKVVVLESTANQPPIADAGETVIFSLPRTTTTLNGLGYDNDGTIVSYSWRKKSGPSANLTNQNTPTLTISNLVAGSYIFELQVSDDDGATAKDNMQLIVNPSEINQNPVANAGTNFSIVLPTNLANLGGTGADPDGQIEAYQWSQITGPSIATFTNANLANATASALEEGVYVFKFTVTDNDGAIDEDEVRIDVLPESANIKPIANAGADQTTFLPTNTINISGFGSDDDGVITSFNWRKISGPSSVVLANTQTSTLTLSELISGIYEFSLTVIDDDGASNSDLMKLRVFPASTNRAPDVDAGADITISTTTSLSIQASVSDPDGTITSLLWTQTSGSEVTLEDISTSTLVVKDLIEGVFNFRLRAIDDDGAVNFDEIKVTVLSDDANVPPSSNAGEDITVKLPLEKITIQGSGSDPEGEISTYLWEKVSGLDVSLNNVNTSNLEVTDLVEGSYIFSLQVEDAEGALDQDEMTLLVLSGNVNLSPTVSAGPDQFHEEESGTLTFNADANDEDGFIVAYNWQKISGGPLSLSGNETSELKIADYTAGLYQFRVEVSDDKGSVASDLVTLTVFEENTKSPPIISAGSDTVLIYPIDSLELNGIVESDNIIENYKWSQVLGPQLDILPRDTNNVVLVKPRRGVYLFSLTVTDVDSLTSTDQVKIIIKDEDESNDFPLLFTPNNDGVNDYWVVEDNDKITDCTLIIYDLNGREVFQSSSYQNDWDGTSNGSPLPAGAYYYTFNCNTDSKITGGLRIIR